jgi:hypothetical protein
VVRCTTPSARAHHCSMQLRRGGFQLNCNIATDQPHQAGTGTTRLKQVFRLFGQLRRCQQPVKCVKPIG